MDRKIFAVIVLLSLLPCFPCEWSFDTSKIPTDFAKCDNDGLIKPKIEELIKTTTKCVKEAYGNLPDEKKSTVDSCLENENLKKLGGQFVSIWETIHVDVAKCCDTSTPESMAVFRRRRGNAGPFQSLLKCIDKAKEDGTAISLKLLQSKAMLKCDSLKGIMTSLITKLLPKFKEMEQAFQQCLGN